MISLTHKEKKWTLFFLLPCYFVFGQIVLSFLFMMILNVFSIDVSSQQIDAWFNLVYLIVMTFIFIIIYKSYLTKSIQHMKGKWLRQMVYAGTLGTLQFYLFNIVSSLLIYLLSPNSLSANQQSIVQLTDVAPAIMIATAVIFAPFVEEMVFRVGIFQLFYDKNRILAYLLSSLSFGFVHIMNGLFSGDFTQLLFLFPYSLLGFALCHFYEKRNSIFVPMVIHSLNNLVAMLMLL